MSRATKKRPTAEQLEAANLVLQAQRDADEQDKLDANRACIGRFYRYSNSYGSGSRWWLYFAVTDARSYGGCTGWSFQRDSNGQFEFQPKAAHYVAGHDSWQEVTPAQFRQEARKFVASIARQFAPSSLRRPRQQQRKK